jgi:hypothetical protein
MKLQDQCCCTREQDRRLVELGIKMEATFSHMPAKSMPHHGEYIRYGWHGEALVASIQEVFMPYLVIPAIEHVRKYWNENVESISVHSRP